MLFEGLFADKYIIPGYSLWLSLGIVVGGIEGDIMSIYLTFHSNCIILICFFLTLLISWYFYFRHCNRSTTELLETLEKGLNRKRNQVLNLYFKSYNWVLNQFFCEITRLLIGKKNKIEHFWQDLFCRGMTISSSLFVSLCSIMWTQLAILDVFVASVAHSFDLTC